MQISHTYRWQSLGNLSNWNCKQFAWTTYTVGHYRTFNICWQSTVKVITALSKPSLIGCGYYWNYALLGLSDQNRSYKHGSYSRSLWHYGYFLFPLIYSSEPCLHTITLHYFTLHYITMQPWMGTVSHIGWWLCKQISGTASTVTAAVHWAEGGNMKTCFKYRSVWMK